MFLVQDIQLIFCRFLETEDGQETTNISQHDIAGAVDMMSAQKVSV